MISSCPKHLRTIGPLRSGNAGPTDGVIQLSASSLTAAARQCAGTLRLAVPRRHGRPTKSTSWKSCSAR
eukprot:12214522-Alexandrium_andersonii.AAC.1